MSERNFFGELKRRNVYKVAVAYAVIAWLLIQAASILFPTFEAPGWVMKVFVVILATGFIIALLIAWAFEMTPQGMKRTEDVSPDENIPQWSRKKFAAVITLVALGAAVLLAFQLLRPKSLTIPPGMAAIPEKSIAVLPFDNLSRDPDNAYFVEGIQDEILTRLAKIAELKVISRTSTQRFKSASGDLRQIAQQLGVTNILEGSVQKTSDQVRVNVQLINASTDAHLWADTYDRKLTDIFAVESEIAKSVAEMLQAKLTGSAKQVLASRPTENPEAHQLYLKGRYFWNKRGTANLEKAIEYFQLAIEKDPTYALAYAGLADAHVLLPQYARTRPKDDIDKGSVAARKAVELDDSLAEAHTSLANALDSDMQFAAAIAQYQKAIALNPNYATAHQWYGEALQAAGRFDEAVAELKRAQELDPLSVVINTVVGQALGFAGRYDEAIEQLRKTIEMEPTFYLAHWFLGEVFETKGDLAQAIVEYERARQLDPDSLVRGKLGHAYAMAGRQDDARRVLDELTTLSKQRFVPSYARAIIHLALGEKDEALRLLEQSYADRENDIAAIKFDFFLKPLHGDPRFEALVQRVIGPKP